MWDDLKNKFYQLIFQVIITNFLADYSPIWGHTPEEDSEEFRLDVINDLKVLLKLKFIILK